MRTLNEQIQRLRDVLVTCYNAIKRKGGTIPEEGLRNMSNLPAAVLSIPQTHGVLTDLEVTSNGEYLPADYDADGFSKVTARFDTSSLPKVKVGSFYVTNACANENGEWDGATLIDTSECTNFKDVFRGTNAFINLDLRGLNTSKVTNLESMFNSCRNLQNINLSRWDTSKVTNSSYVFTACRELVNLDLSGWDTTQVTKALSMFSTLVSIKHLDLTHFNMENLTENYDMFGNLFKLSTLIGGKSIEDVINDNISCLKNLKVSTSFNSTILDRASLRALINGLADVNDQPAESRPTLTLGTTLLAKLTDEDIAILTNKGWNLA